MSARSRVAVSRPRSSKAPVLDGARAMMAQALADVSVADCADVVFVRAPSPALVDAWCADALGAGFAVARASLAEHPFDLLDGLVRAIAGRLEVRAPAAVGWVPLLGRFAREHGDEALALFDADVAARGVAGDLITLSRAVIAAPTSVRREERELAAWLAGTSLKRVSSSTVAMPLTLRTARRALVELTALVRILGHAGTFIVFEEGETLARLPAARRRAAYTVLRELIDDGDGGRGLASARMVVCGGDALFEGARSMAELEPLAQRIGLARPGAAVPHAPLFDAREPPTGAPTQPTRSEHADALRAVIRISHGLPPVEAIRDASVGQEQIDRRIDGLFAHASMDSSVFAMFVGRYGDGKTHLLLHLAARALAERRPVFRLSLETLDADLGNPQRHLRRLLALSTLPVAGRPSALERLVAWTRSARDRERLIAAISAVATRSSELAADAAERLAARLRRARDSVATLESFLSGADLASKAPSAAYRRDAYGRLLLWLELLAELDACAGPVLLVDEAENLYGGVSRPERRTALRSLAFYCGGALPRAVVVVAMTPSTYAALRTEAVPLLAEIATQKTVLSVEDALMLQRRFARIEPFEVPALSDSSLAELCERTRALHARARGAQHDPGWAQFVSSLVAERPSPRALVHSVIDRLEQSWWTGKGMASS